MLNSCSDVVNISWLMKCLTLIVNSLLLEKLLNLDLYAGVPNDCKDRVHRGRLSRYSKGHKSLCRNKRTAANTDSEYWKIVTRIFYLKH